MTPVWGVDLGVDSSAVAIEGRILVLPFATLNKSADQSWLGQSIQQSIVADLMTSAPGRIMSSDVSAADSTTAVAAGKAAGARYVILGSFASLPQDIRVTGIVIDSTTGYAVAAIKATGSTSNIFTLEDDLSAQIHRHLRLRGQIPGEAPAPVITQVPPMQPLRVLPQPTDPYVGTYGPAANPAAPAPSYPSVSYDYSADDSSGSDDSDDTTPWVPWGWYWPYWGWPTAYIYTPWYWHHGHFYHSRYHASWAGRHHEQNSSGSGTAAQGKSPSSVNTSIASRPLSGGLRTGTSPGMTSSHGTRIAPLSSGHVSSPHVSSPHVSTPFVVRGGLPSISFGSRAVGGMRR
jgi:TolB-like protein